MSDSLATVLAETAARHGDRPALRLDEVALNYRELAQRSEQLAGAFAQWGVMPGDRVALMLPNVPAFAIAYYAILLAGAIVVPMNIQLKRREVAFCLGDAGARLALIWHELVDAAGPGALDAGAQPLAVASPAGAELIAVARPDGSEPLRADGSPVPPAADGLPTPRGGDDTAVILYTSGTTGQPKGAELTHHNLRSNAAIGTRLPGMSDADVVLGVLPLFHSFGQTCAMNAAFMAGACLSLLPRFDAGRALEVIARDRVSIFLGVPTMYGAILAHPAREHTDCSSLRVCMAGGAALPLELLRSFERAFGCVILEGYGLSEASPVASFNHADRPRKPGSIGTPIADVEMRIVDEADRELPVGEVGEIVIRGPNVMKGYWRQPQATSAALRNGWLHTRDLARVDADGYFFIVDRKKDLIIRGGYNVYPREVEEVLYEHPAVREAAVLALPDARLGEEVGAAVVLEPTRAATAEELREHCRQRIAAYKYPRVIWFVEELPKGATGKILKRAISLPGDLLANPSDRD